MTLKRAFVSVVCLVVLNYSAMVLWSLPIIRAQTGGLLPFDLRFTGYAFEDAQAFLRALSPEGKAQYQGAQRLLDLAFPLLFGLSLALAFFMMFKPVWACVFSGFAVLFTLSDWRENHLVGRMLALGADGIDVTLVSVSSQATTFKFFMVALCLTILLFKGLGILLGKWKS